MMPDEVKKDIPAAASGHPEGYPPFSISEIGQLLAEITPEHLAGLDYRAKEAVRIAGLVAARVGDYADSIVCEKCGCSERMACIGHLHGEANEPPCHWVLDRLCSYCAGRMNGLQLIEFIEAHLPHPGPSFKTYVASRLEKNIVASDDALAALGENLVVHRYLAQFLEARETPMKERKGSE